MTTGEKVVEKLDGGKCSANMFVNKGELADAIDAAVAEEREACAKAAEVHVEGVGPEGPEIAAAIRARGERRRDAGARADNLKHTIKPI